MTTHAWDAGSQMGKNYYAILGVPKDADDETLKKARIFSFFLNMFCKLCNVTGQKW